MSNKALHPTPTRTRKRVRRLSRILLLQAARQPYVGVGELGRSAMNNRYFILPLLFGILVACYGCQKKQPFNLSHAQIMNHLESLPGKIYISQGAIGPYFEGPSTVGKENAEGSFHVTTKQGRQPDVSWPATPGYYYETTSYINQTENVYYVVRKIPSGKK